MSQQSPRPAYRVATWVATGFGVGRMPVAPGTFGTLVGVALYLVLRELSVAAYVVGVVSLFAVGVWLCGLAERALGAPDHAAIVFDEIVGYLVTMCLAPPGWIWPIAGFALFRVFDIGKPFPVSRAERLPGGLGVMADDIVAGLYGLVALQAIAWLVGAWRG